MPGAADCRIAAGTADFTTGPAMTRAQAVQAIAGLVGDGPLCPERRQQLPVDPLKIFSGLAGEIESPTIGLTQSMTCKMTFTSATKDVFDILDWTLQPLFECYSALQIVDESTSIRESIPYRLNIVGRPKNMSLGTMEQGKKHGNDLELEVTRLEILLDGEEQLLIDKINFIYKVQGTDLLAAVRVQMGLNA